MCNYTVFNPPEGMYEFVRKIIPDVRLNNGVIVYHNHQVLMGAVQKYHEVVKAENGNGHKQKMPRIRTPF